MKIEKYLNQSPIFALNSAAEKLIPRINSELKEENLNLLQALVLTAVFFEDKVSVRPSLLASTLETSRGNISHILSALEAKSYIKRIVNPHDAREFEIQLKAEGRKKALSLIRFFDQLQKNFEDHLGVSNCTKLVSDLRKLNQMNRA